VRIALGIEYDGSRYCGWQTQPSGGAVQDCLERALSQIAAHPVTTQCAGRTDAGVHALGQVVHFDTDAQRPSSAWVRGANTLLPRSCAVLWACPVPGDFHARSCARGRGYLYVLLNRRERPGVFAEHIGWHHHDLDLGRMREAAAMLLGTHDFSAFRASECQARSPVKTMRSIQIEQRGRMFVFHLRADAFLHHMVRNIVGSLVRVGNGSRPAGWMGEVLEGRDRSRAAPTFAPGGLYLAQVEYDARWKLPAPATGLPALLERLPLPALVDG